ncbi:SdpI family protein [Pseudonocardia sp. CA-107938]|uniref:SdpI family protein n=1 Tax=Pseudonocardia sp. CA-107938 TaxID=3240021 RepID=UPI003D8F6BC0
MPAFLGPILGGLLLLAGLLLLTIAALGARGSLPRNRVAGIKTAATLASDAAFTTAHKAAAVPLAAAGAVAAVPGIVLLTGPSAGLAWTLVAVGVLGLLVFAGLAGTVGDRAAAAVAPAPMPSCAGACAGCDLVAGCRDAAVGQS